MNAITCAYAHTTEQIPNTRFNLEKVNYYNNNIVPNDQTQCL